MAEPSRQPLRRHDVQLTAVFVTDITAHRRDTREKDPPEPRIVPRRGQLLSRSEDGLTIAVGVSAAIRVRLPDQQTWDARLSARGTFASAIELSEEDAVLFAATSGFFVLWPFVRTHLDLAAKLAGIVGAPQLPLLLRPAPAPPRRK